MPVHLTSRPTVEEKEKIFNLWNKEYPEKLRLNTIADLDNYLDKLSGIHYYFLKNDLNEIEGWAITFTREEEKWFALVVDSNMHGKGKGTLLLNAIKDHEEILNGWVIDGDKEAMQNGEMYTSPLLFYKKNNFIVYPEIRIATDVMSGVKIVWKKNE